jgi:hypothetical protein
MKDEDLAVLQPKDIDEALDCMEAGLKEFHDRPDKRALFLRVYYEMTLEVYDAINGKGDYAGQAVFLDPDWVRRLSGKFASLYFRSITVTGPVQDGKGDRAWKAANKAARDNGSTVLQNVLLGINAHINHDLAMAIAENLDPAELKNPATLQMRKFDHDQVNNLLVRSLGRIQEILARDYDPGLGIGDLVLGRFDERLSEVGLTYYRERVWWNAITYAAAMADDLALDVRDEEAPKRLKTSLVRDKLDWESYKVAQYLQARPWMWWLEGALGLPWTVLGRKQWDRIQLAGRDAERTAKPIRINVLG